MEPLWFKSYPKKVPHEIDISKYKSVDQAIGEACRKFASRPAITYGVNNFEKTYTYADLDRLADKFGAFLQKDLGLKKGERIAIMLPNTAQFIVAFMGAARVGVVCVNTNPLYTPREMEHQFKDSGAVAIVILDMFADKLEQVIDATAIQHIIMSGIGDLLSPLHSMVVGAALKFKKKLPSHHLKNVVSFKTALRSGARQRIDKPSFAPNDICVLQYTGGTTGVSKGAILTQKNILANTFQICAAATGFLNYGDEIVLTAIPLYHIFALSVNFITFFMMGQHMILVPQPIPIKNTVDVFRKYKVTVVTGVNTLFNALNNDSGFKALAPRQIKFAIAGGMALQDSVAAAWKAITGNTLIQGFGLTEASPVTHVNPFGEVPSMANSIGVPLPSTDAKCVDENGKEVPLGEPGELLIRGPQVMLGYWQKPEETESVLKDGWLWTGDIARVDDKGFFYIVDRKKDMILVSGFNVYPNEIEAVLATHPKVLESAVIGVPDRSSGEAVKAFIVPKDSSLSIDDLKDFCRDQLTGYKRPRHFEIRESLPKSNVGKILRKDLRKEELSKKAGKNP